MSGIGSNIPGSAFGEYGTLLNQDFIDDQIMLGHLFGIARRFPIPKTESYCFAIDGSGIDSGKIFDILPLNFSGFGAGPIEIDIYFDAVISGGTSVIPLNRNHNSTIFAQAVVTENPVITDHGTKLLVEFYMFSNGTAAVASLGGSVKGDLPMIANKDGIYLIKLTNTSTVEDAFATFAMDFGEI